MHFCKLRFCFRCLWYVYSNLCGFLTLHVASYCCVWKCVQRLLHSNVRTRWAHHTNCNHLPMHLESLDCLQIVSCISCCPRPIPQQDSSMLLQDRSFVWTYIVNYMNIIISCWCRCASWNSCTSLHNFTSIIFWSSWAPPFGARRCHGAVKRCPWAAPNVAPRPRRHAAPWRRHHRRPGLEAPPADRPRSLTIKIYPKYLIYFHLLPPISKCNCLHTSTYSCVLSRIHIKMASKLFWF